MRKIGVLAAAAAVCLALPQMAAADNLRIESTTDTQDAGLVDGILTAAYKAAQPGDTFTYHAVGTGAALTNARNGLADVVITHAPSLEAQFVKDGYSLGLGRQIFYSDYVIVGPKDDPAGVATKHPNDAVSAYEDIAAAGLADPSTVRFRSRADNSGTNVQEQIIWKLTDVAKQASTNTPADTTRAEPVGSGGAGTFPAWYIRDSSGQALNLTRTEACVVAGNGCYTMIDRGTYNKQVNDGVVTHLKIVSQKNTAPNVRGGANLLVNPFSIYIVNPDKITTDPKPNVAGARRFADFMVSASFQQALLSFPTALDPAFLPDAFPELRPSAALPQTAVAGTTVTVSGTAFNRLPGAGAIKGLPVQAQQSTDNGATWTNAGAAVPAGNDGTFSVSVPATQTARFRLSTPSFPASEYNEFSASQQDLGVLTVTPVAPPPVVKDTKKPSVTKVKLGRRGITLHVSEAGKVKLVISQRVRKGKKVSYKKIQTVNLKATKARTLSGKHKKLKAGRYRVQVTATDLAGNKKTLTRTFTLK